MLINMLGVFLFILGMSVVFGATGVATITGALFVIAATICFAAP